MSYIEGTVADIIYRNEQNSAVAQRGDDRHHRVEERTVQIVVYEIEYRQIGAGYCSKHFLILYALFIIPQILNVPSTRRKNIVESK